MSESIESLIEALPTADLILIALKVAHLDPALRISEFDRENIGKILDGHGDWWGADMLRLIARSDEGHKVVLSIAFPSYVHAYRVWAGEEAP